MGVQAIVFLGLTVLIDYYFQQSHPIFSELLRKCSSRLSKRPKNVAYQPLTWSEGKSLSLDSHRGDFEVVMPPSYFYFYFFLMLVISFSSDTRFATK